MENNKENKCTHMHTLTMLTTCRLHPICKFIHKYFLHHHSNNKYKRKMNSLKLIIALIFIIIVNISAKQLRAKKDEPTSSHMPQKIDEEWRKYVVPAGEKDQGKTATVHNQLWKKI